MIKHTVTYTDFNDNEVTEDLYFNLTKAELAEMLMEEDDYETRLRRIVENQNRREIMAEFKRLLLLAYGQRSEGGAKFIKSDEMREGFFSSEAYSELFFFLCTNADKAAEFIQGLMPKKLQEEARAKLAEVANSGAQDAPTVEDSRPAWLKENRPPTEEEIRGMSYAELQVAFRERASR